MKRTLCLLLALAAALLSGCADKTAAQAEKTTVTYYDYFDTVTSVSVYGASEVQINKIVDGTFGRLHAVFDAYAPHDGISGLYALNHAGGEWVTVEPELMTLIDLCATWRGEAPELDITYGALFELWRAFRDGERELPTEEELRAASAHSGWENVEIDRAGGRVRLDDPEMSLDLGAVAKGYASGILGKAIADAGYESYLVDAGGNVMTGAREKPFVIGVTNPRGDGILMKLSMENMAAVTSGDYQRYREYEGVRYHHLIDVSTLYPANNGTIQVTVLNTDSGYADFLSTTLFIMNYEEARAFADGHGIEAIWVMADGTTHMTDGARGMVVD